MATCKKIKHAQNIYSYTEKKHKISTLFLTVFPTTAYSF